MTMQTETAAMPRVIRDVDAARRELTRRRGFEETELSSRMQDGIRRVFGADLTAEQVVDRILSEVRSEGDAAVSRYAAALDGDTDAQFEVPRSAWQDALAGLEPALRDALRLAAEQIAAFHRKQLRTSWVDYSDEGSLGQIVRPLDRVGVYAPGGTAIYPSSLLMTAIPARVAGVQEIVVCSPSGPGGA
ncbi:MAG: histidinol dehydrogenase, partial [Thermomicrobiales bacterium]|nr:histidinol dehydrogenase [Thermomicrobiales bacterium]